MARAKTTAADIPQASAARTRSNGAASRAADRHRDGDRCGPEEHARRLRTSHVSDEQLERTAALFRAAGDVSRLKLLDRLCDGEWCVTELADALRALDPAWRVLDLRTSPGLEVAPLP